MRKWLKLGCWLTALAAMLWLTGFVLGVRVPGHLTALDWLDWLWPPE